VWLSERVAVPLDKPHPYEPSIDPWIGLAFIAAATKRVVLSTTVSQIALRDPVIMARELATLDILAQGRMIVGAGAGWVEAEFAATHVPYETRGKRLGEFVQVLRKLWTAPEEGWHGQIFQVPGVMLAKPFTPGGPKIYMGAGSPAGLRRAARLADGLLCVTLPLEGVIASRARVLEEREKQGKGGPFPVWAQVEPPETVEAAQDVAAQYREAGIDGIILSERLARDAGFPKDDGVSRALIEAAG
jgi:alkanesulfonate monooxygenase SsuD/methylene tetrahydromethanopterin reductase-like flavin-dependent oxidoreductase (luciferase family)